MVSYYKIFKWSPDEGEDEDLQNKYIVSRKVLEFSPSLRKKYQTYLKYFRMKSHEHWHINCYYI